MSILGPVPNQGFNQAKKCLAYQASLYFFKPICFSIKLAKRIFSHSCIGFAIRFKPTQPIKTSIRPEILKCYIIKVFYVFKIIGTELKQPTKKQNITT